VDQESTPQKDQDHELMPAGEEAGSEGSAPSSAPTVAGEAPGNFSPPEYTAPPPPPGYQALVSPSGYQAAGTAAGYQAPGYPTVPLPGDPAAQLAAQQQGGWGTAAPGYGAAPLQHGFPGAPGAPPGAAWPAGAVPQRKRRRGLLLVVVAVVAAVIAGSVTGAVLILKKSESPTAMAQQAGQAIGRAAGVTLSGSYNLTPANLTVTKADTVVGTLSAQIPDQPVTLLTINGQSYVKAPEAFWNLIPNTDPTAAKDANGLWAKIPPGNVASFASFTPRKIAGVLEHVGTHPYVRYTMLGHTKVIKLDTGGISYYVTTSTPNRLLRMDSGQTITTSGYSFDITPLTATTIGPAFTLLHSDVQALQDAQDPTAYFTNVSQVNTDSNCASSPTSCTASMNVTVTDPHSAAVLVTMTIDFSGTENGPSFGSCQGTAPASTNNSSTGVAVVPTCTLSGQAWTGWINSQEAVSTTGVINYWVGGSLGVEVNTASDVAALQNTLDQQQRG
jgi:hypothetical protein